MNMNKNNLILSLNNNYLLLNKFLNGKRKKMNNILNLMKIGKMINLIFLQLNVQIKIIMNKMLKHIFHMEYFQIDLYY